MLVWNMERPSKIKALLTLRKQTPKKRKGDSKTTCETASTTCKPKKRRHRSRSRRKLEWEEKSDSKKPKEKGGNKVGIELKWSSSPSETDSSLESADVDVKTLRKEVEVKKKKKKIPDSRLGRIDEHGRVDGIVKFQCVKFAETLPGSYFSCKGVKIQGMLCWLEYGREVQDGAEYLSLFFHMKPNQDDPPPITQEKGGVWKCFANLEYRVLPRKGSTEVPLQVEFSEVLFSEGCDGHGHYNFRPWNDISDPDNGYTQLKATAAVGMEVIVRDVTFFRVVNAIKCWTEFGDLEILSNESLIPFKERLFLSKKKSDIDLLLPNYPKELHFHREILSYDCLKLASFLEEKLEGKSSGKVGLSGEPFMCTSHSLTPGVDTLFIHLWATTAFFSYFYRKEVMMDDDCHVQIFAFADYFNVKPVRILCLEQMEDTDANRKTTIPKFLPGYLEYFVKCDKQEEFADFSKNHMQVLCDLIGRKRPFKLCCKMLIQKLLELEELEISEIHLFLLMVYWASRECKRRNMPISGKNMRSVLGRHIVYLIRYPIISDSDFKRDVLYPRNLGLLTSQEVDILNGVQGSPPLPETFNSNYRKGQSTSTSKGRAFVISTR